MCKSTNYLNLLSRLSANGTHPHQAMPWSNISSSLSYLNILELSSNTSYPVTFIYAHLSLPIKYKHVNGGKDLPYLYFQKTNLFYTLKTISITIISRQKAYAFICNISIPNNDTPVNRIRVCWKFLSCNYSTVMLFTAQILEVL